eukprot:scaffold67457_cov90-Attheya_sp.AAC.4
MDYPEHDSEGRIIAVDFPRFFWPTYNIGPQLRSLSRSTIISNRKVGYRLVWNEGAKHLAKIAGTTPEESASFAQQLDAGFVDAFRFPHPKPQGPYTYWSQRAGNRALNKGMRLEEFNGR